ncbi:MAG: 5-formyltetrahydrofolate cyclo-ligase [Thalassobaculaceae bacterium]
MQDVNLIAEKKQLRNTAEKRRQFLFQSKGIYASKRLAKNFCSTWSPAYGSIISAFWPFRTELDVRPLIHHLFGLGYTIALPEITSKYEPLIFREWKPRAEFNQGQFLASCAYQKQQR